MQSDEDIETMEAEIAEEGSDQFQALAVRPGADAEPAKVVGGGDINQLPASAAPNAKTSVPSIDGAGR